MYKLATCGLVACLACGGRTTLVDPELDSGAEDDLDAGIPTQVLYLPASSTTGVATMQPLRLGLLYTVTIEGTISVWPSGDWAAICDGTPSPSPLFPSPGDTGPVGVDAEWVWAWPTSSPSLCPSGVSDATPPVAQRKLRLEAESGAPPEDLPPPREGAMTANHAYTYSLMGGGTTPVFVVNEVGQNTDGSPHIYNPGYNYGELRIEVVAGTGK
jgi:hypothetical protein